MVHSLDIVNLLDCIYKDKVASNLGLEKDSEGRFIISTGNDWIFRINYLSWCNLYYIETKVKRKFNLLTFEQISDFLRNYSLTGQTELLTEYKNEKQEFSFSAEIVSQLCYVLINMYVQETKDLIKFGIFELKGSGDSIEYTVKMTYKGKEFITLKFNHGTITTSAAGLGSKLPNFKTLPMSLIAIFEHYKVLDEGLNVNSLGTITDGTKEEYMNQYLLKALPFTVKRITEVDFI